MLYAKNCGMHGISSKIRNALTHIFEIPGAGQRYKSMEGVRAYAALLVFFVHYSGAYLRNYRGIDADAESLLTMQTVGDAIIFYFWASHYGVDIFFFLSGFLICRMVVKDGFDYARFAFSRFLRVYPAALIAICFWAWFRIYYLKWYEPNPIAFIQNLFFLNAVPSLEVRAYLVPTWSLFFEMVFYLIFPPLFVVFKKTFASTPLAVLLTTGLFILALNPVVFSSVRFLMFFGGVTLALLSKEQIEACISYVPGWLATTLFLLSTLIFTITISYILFIPFFVVTTFFFVTHILYGGGVLQRVFSFTPLRWLGNISYSFYLMHTLGVHIVLHSNTELFAALNEPVRIFTTVVLSFTLSVLFATILYMLAERPYLTRKGAVGLASAP